MSLKGNFHRKDTSPVINDNMSPAEKAKAVWDEREGNLVVQAYNWRRISLILCGVVSVLVISLVVQSFKSTIQPYIVEVDTLDGTVRNAGLLVDQNYKPDEAVTVYYIKEFIMNTRGITLDPVVNGKNAEKAANFMTATAKRKLDALLNNENYLSKAGMETVTVNIISVLPIEESNSYQVRWEEEIFSVNGGSKTVVPMTGVFTITSISPESEEQIMRNPLGIYISDMFFSKDQVDNSKKGNKSIAQNQQKQADTTVK